MIKPLPLEMLTEWIITRRPFALVRYGDGEFACLMQQSGQNCDGVAFSPELAAGIEASIRNPLLTHCLSSVALHYGAEAWIAKHASDVEWYESDQVMRASAEGSLWPFRAAVFNSHMLYVGPERLRYAVQEGLGAYDLVEVPLTTAFEEIAMLARETSKQIKAKNYRLVGVSAGPAAKALIDKLARKHAGVTFVDFGSVWDVYAGVPTRSGPKRLTNAQVDWLAWKNFHWQRSAKLIAMPPPHVHDLLAIPGLVTEAEMTFLYRMARTAPTGVTIELGTFRGRTAAMLARAARETGGRVISIDNYSYWHHPLVGEPARNLAKFGLRADFREGDSRVVPPDIGEVSCLYVDSAHTEAHVDAELDVWLPLIVPGGVIVFHDYGNQDVTNVVTRRMGGYTQLGQERRMIAFRREIDR